MALNFSHRPIFPAHLAEDHLVAPVRISNGFLVEGIPDRRTDGFVSPWFSGTGMEVNDCFDYEGRGIHNNGGESQESSVPNDVLDLLPADPFGMDMNSFTAITGWLELGYGGYGKKAEASMGRGDCPIFAELNFICNKAMEFNAFTGIGDQEVVDSKVLQRFAEHDFEMSMGLCYGHEGQVCDIGEMSSCGQNSGFGQDRDFSMGTAMCVDGGDESPHPALAFCLGYLGIRDLLSVERVCKSLRDTVQSDSLLWKTIHVGQPLNDRLTDDILLRLTNRAQGNLQCLSLVECSKITEGCLRQILDDNPRLTKLNVPACTKLSTDGILSCLKSFNAVAIPGIKYLRVQGRPVTQNQLEDLKLILGANSLIPTSNRKPHYHIRGNTYLSVEDDRAIDMDICPWCKNVRMIYDCPAESCQGKYHGMICRGCTNCIPRCMQCGKCLSDAEYEETFCLENICTRCNPVVKEYRTQSLVLHTIAG